MATVRTVIYMDYIIGEIRKFADEMRRDGGSLFEEYPLALAIEDVLSRIGVPDGARALILGPEWEQVSRHVKEPICCQYDGEEPGTHLVEVGDGYRIACEAHAQQAIRSGCQVICPVVLEPEQV